MSSKYSMSSPKNEAFLGNYRKSLIGKSTVFGLNVEGLAPRSPMTNSNEEPQPHPQHEELLSQIRQIPPDLIAALFQYQGQQPPLEITPNPENLMNARGSWSQQEDDLLKNAISQLGTKKWSDIARFVPTRTSKQCRERWFNRLSPQLKHGPFEEWEDKIIIEKQKEVGNRWSVIAQSLPGRSSGAVKNRWHSGLKNQAENKQADISISTFPHLVQSDQVQQQNGDDQLYNSEL
ncbi:Myb-like DNA-binding domain containing protein [Tritrichomonas foetus]|uniref:Myb-like DNA-binding domain containing protein n=1 Tax=Tritrichomonas foetus TaxID=1144522 RepID=A0A1J4K9E7_9EUKA|nr:Myb-like DNA-binding domain containing protein [Tritrichomonas foetus]|eukprot:OHT07562.1 Myb-like DNA-binding domain containing protein [Tritrichomonas foetus]